LSESIVPWGGHTAPAPQIARRAMPVCSRSVEVAAERQAPEKRRFAVNHSKHSAWIQALLIVALVAAIESVRAANAETAADVLAVQIRSQGHVCDKPQQATRDPKLSKPDYDVWVLKCENATYRLGRYPNLPANIEKLSDDEAADRKK
jgi:hypothetical protein